MALTGNPVKVDFASHGCLNAWQYMMVSHQNNTLPCREWSDQFGNETGSLANIAPAVVWCVQEAKTQWDVNYIGLSIGDKDTVDALQITYCVHATSRISTRTDLFDKILRLYAIEQNSGGTGTSS